MHGNLEGEITVTTGHDDAEIELPHSGKPSSIAVWFEDVVPPPCDPHHHHHHKDQVEWKLFRKGRRYTLRISWQVVSVSRQIRWRVC